MKRTFGIFAAIFVLYLLMYFSWIKPLQGQDQSSIFPKTTMWEKLTNIFRTKRMMQVCAPLSDSETEEIAIQSQFLQDAGIEKMTKTTANELAEYFVRCHRVDPAESEATIVGCRYEKLPSEQRGVHWGFWILTSSNGTDYWFYGLTRDTFDNPFHVLFVNRDKPYGELLYGFYR